MPRTEYFTIAPARREADMVGKLVGDFQRAQAALSALQRRRKECGCLHPGEAVKEGIVGGAGHANLADVRGGEGVQALAVDGYLPVGSCVRHLLHEGRDVICGRIGVAVAPPGPPPGTPTVDVQSVGKQVVGLLQDQWNRDPLNEYGITVDADGMTLINTGLNKYDGLTTVHTRKGTQKFLSVTVWADPTGAMFYQMDTASASNVIDAAKKEQPNRCWGGSSC
jgi:hypothetical protein